MKSTTKVILVGNTPLAFFLAQILSKKENLTITVLKTEENELDFDTLPVFLTQSYSNLFHNDWVILSLRPKRLEIESFFHNMKGFQTIEFLEKNVPVKRFKPGLLSLVPGLLMEDIKTCSLFSKNVLTGFVQSATLPDKVDLSVSGADDEINSLTASISSDSVKKIKNKHIWRDFVLNDFVSYLSMFFFKNQTLQSMTKIRDWCNLENQKNDIQSINNYFKDFALIKSYAKNLHEVIRNKTGNTSNSLQVLHQSFELWMQEKYQELSVSLLNQYNFIEITDLRDPYQGRALVDRQVATRPNLSDFMFQHRNKVDYSQEKIINPAPEERNNYSFVKIAGVDFSEKE